MSDESNIRMTDSVRHALKAWRRINRYSNMTLSRARKKGFIGVKNGKYYVTAKGEKAKPSSTQI